jgi:hypothetical protein
VTEIRILIAQAQAEGPGFVASDRLRRNLRVRFLVSP